MDKKSQSETISLIFLTLTTLAVGSGITCHMVRKHYELKIKLIEQQFQIDNKKTIVVEDKKDVSKELITLMSSLEEMKRTKELLLDLTKKVDELSQKEQSPVVIKQVDKTVDYNALSLIKDLKKQIEEQNKTISNLNEKILVTQYSIKEYVTNSWVNDQKLNEIKELLKKQSLTQKNTQQPAVLEKPNLKVLVENQKESTTNVYQQERLSVKSNLPPDYESPKVKYKNDELK